MCWDQCPAMGEQGEEVKVGDEQIPLGIGSEVGPNAFLCPGWAVGAAGRYLGAGCASAPLRAAPGGRPGHRHTALHRSAGLGAALLAPGVSFHWGWGGPVAEKGRIPPCGEELGLPSWPRS